MANTDTKAKTDDLAGLEAGLDALDAVQTHRTPVREVLVKKVLPPFLAVGLVLVVWQVLVSLKVTDETKLPALSAVWDSLSDMWLKGTLLEVIWTSVSRGLLGFLLALAIGTPLGLLVPGTWSCRPRCPVTSPVSSRAGPSPGAPSWPPRSSPPPPTSAWASANVRAAQPRPAGEELSGVSPVLLVIAHGSRDPRHAATVHALTRRARALRPGLRVETAFLDFNAPRVEQVLSALHADGVRDVVALPLLLTRAFHAKADIPATLSEALTRLPGLSVSVADVLGPSPLLVDALERRLAEAGLTPADRATTAVVLASAGSTDPEAIAVIAEIAREWRHTGWCAVRPAFASAALPRTEDAVRALRAEGFARVAVAPYVIAPGRLPDRIAAGAEAAGADVVADVLGAAPELALLLLRRYDAAAAAPARLPALTA